MFNSFLDSLGNTLRDALRGGTIGSPMVGFPGGSVLAPNLVNGAKAAPSQPTYQVPSTPLVLNPNYKPPTSSPSISSGSSTQSAPQQTQPQQESAEDIARRLYQDRLNTANRTYDERAAYLTNQLGDAGREKDSLLDRIGATYSTVKQQAQDTLAKNVAALEQGKSDVVQGYADKRTEQARLLGDTQLRNRMMARALGTLNSGFYENLQSKAALNTQSNVSKLGQNERSQLDRIGQEILNQNTDGNTKIQALNETEAAAKTDVINKYQSLFNTIQTQLGFNDRGKLDAVESINNQLAASLDQIGQLFAGYRAAASGLGGVTNPLKDLTGKTGLLPQLTALQTGFLQPVQNDNILNQAYQDLASGNRSFNDIIGYLTDYDDANNSSLLPTFRMNAQQTGGTNLPIIGSLFPATYNTPTPRFTDTSSLLDMLFAQ